MNDLAAEALCFGVGLIDVGADMHRLHRFLRTRGVSSDKLNGRSPVWHHKSCDPIEVENLFEQAEVSSLEVACRVDVPNR